MNADTEQFIKSLVFTIQRGPTVHLESIHNTTLGEPDEHGKRTYATDFIIEKIRDRVASRGQGGWGQATGSVTQARKALEVFNGADPHWEQWPDGKTTTVSEALWGFMMCDTNSDLMGWLRRVRHNSKDKRINYAAERALDEAVATLDALALLYAKPLRSGAQYVGYTIGPGGGLKLYRELPAITTYSAFSHRDDEDEAVYADMTKIFTRCLEHSPESHLAGHSHSADFDKDGNHISSALRYHEIRKIHTRIYTENLVSYAQRANLALRASKAMSVLKGARAKAAESEINRDAWTDDEYIADHVARQLGWAQGKLDTTNSELARAEAVVAEAFEWMDEI